MPFSKVLVDLYAYLLPLKINLNEIFSKLDPPRKLFIALRSFSQLMYTDLRVLDSLVCSTQELNELIAFFDLHQSGHIFYIEFLNKLRNPEYLVGGRPLKPKPSIAWSEKTYRELNKKATTLKVSPETIFTNLDSRRENKLSLPDFTKGLQEIGDFLSPEEQNLLADEFDIRGDGVINYRQFLNKLEDFRSRKQTADRVTQSLLRFCTDKQVDFDDELKQLDHRGTKKLSKADFTSLLQHIGFPVSALDLHSFLEDIPTDEASNLNLTELSKLIPKPKPRFDPLKIAGQIRDYMNDKRMTLEQLFATFDVGRRGSLTIPELSQSLQRIGLVGISMTEAAQLMKEWDRNHDGKLDIEELASAIGITLQSTRSRIPDQDQYFTRESFGTSQYSASFSQPPHASTLHSPSSLQSGYGQTERPHEGQTAASLLRPDQLYSLNSALNAPPFPKIIADLKASFAFNRINLNEVFSKHDIRRTGVLPSRTFEAVIYDDLKVQDYRLCSPQDLTQLFNSFDLLRNGQIHYHEFISKIRNPDYQLGGGKPKPKVSLNWNDKTYQAIVEKVKTHRLNPESVFTRLDTRREGVLHINDFVRGLRDLGDFLNYEEVNLITEEFNTQGNDLINYGQFLIKLNEFTARSQAFDTVTQALAQHCSERRIDFEAELRRIDPSNSKKLTKAELTDILKQIGFVLPGAELYSFIGDLPQDSRGYYDLAETCVRLYRPRIPMDPYKVAGQVKEYMKTNRMAPENLFRVFDRSRYGSVTQAEFNTALQTMKLGLTSEEAAQLMNLWDTKRDGKLDYQELAAGIGLANPEEKLRVACKNKRLDDFVRVSREGTSEFVTYDDLKVGLSYIDPTIDEDCFSAIFKHLDPLASGNLPVHRLKQYFDAPSTDSFIRSSAPQGVYTDMQMRGSAPQGQYTESLMRGSETQGLYPDRTLRGSASTGSLTNTFSRTSQVPAQPHWAEKWIVQITEYCRRNATPPETVLKRYCDFSEVFTIEEFSNAMTMLTLDIDRASIERLVQEFKAGLAIPVKRVMSWLSRTSVDSTGLGSKQTSVAEFSRTSAGSLSSNDLRRSFDMRSSAELNQSSFSIVEQYNPLEDRLFPGESKPVSLYERQAQTYSQPPSQPIDRYNLQSYQSSQDRSAPQDQKSNFGGRGVSVFTFAEKDQRSADINYERQGWERPVYQTGAESTWPFATAGYAESRKY